MRFLHSFFLLVLFTCAGYSAPVSVFNDSPCSADNMGILDTATSCPFSSGGIPLKRLNQSNVGAVAEPLQPALMNCQGVGNMPSQSKDLWYKFRVRAHTLNVIVFGNINTPYIALYRYTGNCMTLVPVECAKGVGGYINTNFVSLLPGAEYYLQVTSALTDAGTFDLVISNSKNCLSCTQDALLFVDRPPVDGFYNSGDTVNFCYIMNGYKRKRNNSLHGVVPVMGPGWSTSVTWYPVTRTSTAPGVWRSGYIYSNLPVIGTHAGFFFDDPSLDGPQNNLGDPGGIADTWVFCWQAIANSCPSPLNMNISIHNFSDGQTGTGQGPGCTEDDKYHFAAKLNCCGAMQTHEATTNCTTVCTGAAIVQISPSTSSFPPLYYYGWFDRLGGLINMTSPTVPQYSDTLSGMCAGSYSVVVSNTAQNCFLAKSLSIKTAFTVKAQQTTFSCSLTNFVSANVTVNPTTNTYSYSWSNGNTNQTATNLFSGQTYVVYVTANSCTLTDTIKLERLPYSNPFFTYPSSLITKCSGGPQFVSPLYIATPGGTFTCGTPGVVDPVTGAINISAVTVTNSYQITYVSPGPCSGTYVVTITIVGQDPAYFHYSSHAVCSSKIDALIPDSVASYGGIFSSSPAGLFIDSTSGIIYPPFNPGSYVITYSSPTLGPCHSVFVDSFFVHAQPPAPQGPTSGYIYCPGDPTVTMTATLTPSCPSCIISWFSDAQFTTLLSTGPTYTGNTNQITPLYFYLIAYDPGTGCYSAPSMIQVTMANYPNVVTSSSDTIVCPGFDGFLHAVPNTTSYSYSWDPSAGLNDPFIADPMFTISSTTTYSVFVTDNTTGCNSSCQVTIRVDSTRNCDTLIFYHGLTPNGDHHNDTWIIDGINKYPKNRVLIFTRWGEKVWDANDYDNRNVVWEGTNQKGIALVPGTYYYVVETPGHLSQKGWVELSR